MNFVLPPKSKVGVLAREIAEEGQPVAISDDVSWAPPPVKPIIPDYSEVKSIKHYFGRSGYKTFPAWFYHPKEPKRLVNTQDEAAQLGIIRREATVHERGMYGVTAVWHYQPDCEWRASPFEKDVAFDPNNPGLHKNVITKENRAQNENAMIERMIPQVAAAVAAALRVAQPAPPSGAPNVDPELWAQFQEFVAFKKAAEVAETTNALAASPDDPSEPDDDAERPLTPTGEAQRADLEAEAIRLGVKFDKRWGNSRLAAAINAAS